MAKNVKTVNKNARYGNMKNSKKRKHKKRRHILLLTSILMLKQKMVSWRRMLYS